MIDVRLIAITRPAAGSDLPDDPEALLAYCARVSNPKNQANHDSGARLLSYLRREGHWSPFEMVHVVMEIQAPRDIARQVLRHRSFSFQEFSQRYAEAPGFCERQIRRQDTKNRQASHDDLPAWKKRLWAGAVRTLLTATTFIYTRALHAGVAKETARTILPEGLTMSRLYMSGSLRSWIHYCEVRRGNGTQAEHVEIADRAHRILSFHFPSAMREDKP